MENPTNAFLEALAETLSKKTLARHLLFLAGALAAIVISGYHFGTFDQVIHLPFLKKFADPSLYPNDPFLDLRSAQYSYFWLMFLPAYRAGVLEMTLFVVHVAATYALFWMFWELTETLFHSKVANLLSVLMLIGPHLGFPGFQFIEFSLLNRTFVLPFVLGGIILYLRKRTWLAFLLMGVMYNIHVIYVNFAMAMILFDCLMRWREVGWKNIIAGVALFVLGAAPVLLWPSGSLPLDLTLEPQILSLSAASMLGSVYFIFLPHPHIWLDNIHGIATLIFFILGRRLNLSAFDRPVTNFVWAIGIVLVVQIITTYWLPVTILLQLQILRVGFFLQIIGYIYLAGYLARRLQQGSLKGMAGALVVASYVTLISPLLVLIFLVLYPWMERARWRQWAGLAGLIALHGLVLYLGLTTNEWLPGLHIFEPKSAWTETQDWARENTPKEAMFITPPHIYFHYTPGWRSFSERGTFATLVEMMHIPYPGYYAYWQERFEAIVPGAISKFNGSYFDTINTTRDAFYSLSSEDYLGIARKYGLRYLVVEKPHLQPFPVVYENDGFVVYDLLDNGK